MYGNCNYFTSLSFRTKGLSTNAFWRAASDFGDVWESSFFNWHKPSSLGKMGDVSVTCNKNFHRFRTWYFLKNNAVYGKSKIILPQFHFGPQNFQRMRFDVPHQISVNLLIQAHLFATNHSCAGRISMYYWPATKKFVDLENLLYECNEQHHFRWFHFRLKDCHKMRFDVSHQIFGNSFQSSIFNCRKLISPGEKFNVAVTCNTHIFVFLIFIILKVNVFQALSP